jgi:hypothetical protein
MTATSLALHGVRFEARAMLRNPRARFFTVLLPVILLASLTAIYGSHDVSTNAGDISPARFFLPAIISLAIVSSCFGALTQSLTTRRQLGVFKRRRAAPAPAWALVLAPSLATTAVAGATAVLMLVLGRVGWGVGLSAGALAGVVLTATIAAACFCAIAFAIAGVVRSAEAVQPSSRRSCCPCTSSRACGSRPTASRTGSRSWPTSYRSCTSRLRCTPPSPRTRSRPPSRHATSPCSRHGARSPVGWRCAGSRGCRRRTPCNAVSEATLAGRGGGPGLGLGVP